MILSAHGVAPDISEQASARGLIVYDAVCPLVAKVHREVERHHGDVFDEYIAEAFSMRSCDRLDLDGIVEGIDPARVEAELRAVREFAEATCERLRFAEGALAD